MGCAEGAHGGARVRAVLDLSNRPHFESNLPFDEEVRSKARGTLKLRFGFGKLVRSSLFSMRTISSTSMSLNPSMGLRHR
jgi:hypothetical protein